jgi:hypothetical protein
MSDDPRPKVAHAMHPSMIALVQALGVDTNTERVVDITLRCNAAMFWADVTIVRRLTVPQVEAATLVIQNYDLKLVAKGEPQSEPEHQLTEDETMTDQQAKPMRRVEDMPAPIPTDWDVRVYIRRTAAHSGFPQRKLGEIDKPDARIFMDKLGYPVNPDKADWPWVAITAAHYINTGEVLPRRDVGPNPIFDMSDEEILAQLPEPYGFTDVQSYMTRAGEVFGLTADQFTQWMTEGAQVEQKLYPHLIRSGQRLQDRDWPRAFVDYVRGYLTPDPEAQAEFWRQHDAGR